MLIVLLLNFGGVGLCVFRNIHETTMEWSECAAGRRKGAGDPAAAALSGGHSFVSVLRERWQLAVVILGLQKSKNKTADP